MPIVLLGFLNSVIRVPSRGSRTAKRDSKGYCENMRNFHEPDHNQALLSKSESFCALLFHSEYYFSSSVALFEICHSLTDLIQRISPVDDRFHFSRLH
jgi:hypothetical protein